jgi:hypothetical protein
MHRVRRSERCLRANAAVNTAADTGAWRSNQTTRKRSDSGYYVTQSESSRASGNTTNESDYPAGNSRDAPEYNARDTANHFAYGTRSRSSSVSDAVAW